MLQKHACHRRSRSPKWFCKRCPGVIWTSGHLFLLTSPIPPWRWERCAQRSPYHAACQLWLALCLTGRTTEISSGLLYHNTGCGCFTSHRTTGGSGDYRSNLWAICAYTHTHSAQHLPANPHAHPASAFALSCFLMQSEKYTKTYNLQNRGPSLKYLCVWVFSSKGYFSLIEL